MRRVWISVAVFVLSMLNSSPAMAQGKIIMLLVPFLDGLSADGKIAVGLNSSSGEAWRWTEEEGAQRIHAMGSLLPPSCPGVFISRDGRTIVGCVNDAEHNMGAGIWQGGQNWSDNIGSLGGKAQDGILTSPYGISGDGSIIVGSSQTPDGKRHAFRWDAKNGMVDLGAMTGEGTTGFSRINGISPDGRVLVGWDEDKGLPAMGGYQQWRGAIWWRGAERLVHPMGWAGEAVVTNSNGSLIAGYGHPASVQTAWLYSAWDGKLYDLGALGEPGSLFDKSFPLAMSDDGLVIVGYCGTNPATVACIWTPDTGMMGLLEYLTARNVAGIEDWTRLAIATAITPDGKVIGGTGVNKNVQGTPSFIVTLP